MNVVSQRWQDITWRHRLIIYIPHRAKYSNTALLVLRHIYNRNAGLASLKVISDSVNTISAFIYDVPNQPLFDGREEDDLQAYTFSQYIKSGDKSWPLLFPMTKSIVRAMDAIEELMLQEHKTPIGNFVVAGHSKRGHATWLAAAADQRIKGIIPIAIDVLNGSAQLSHHLDAFGHYSTPSKEATDFLQELDGPRGKSLIKMIDPYSYKERLRVPKLIVLATNDEYFPTDALNLYWDSLRGPKWILYLSNAGHARTDSDPRINASAFAFVRAIAVYKNLPLFTWEFNRTKERMQLNVKTDTTAIKAVVWVANSQSRDFRQAQWSPTTMKDIPSKESTKQFVIDINRPSSGYSIFYGEIEFMQDGHVFLLSTQTYVSSK